MRPSENASSTTLVNKGKKGKGQSPMLGSRAARRLLKVDVAFGCEPYLVGELRERPRKRKFPLANSG
jgi:hypothetical protein